MSLARFQWPPNPLPEEELGPPSTPGYWKTPPRIEPDHSASPPTPAPAAPAPQTLDVAPSPFRYIETVFLGLTRPTFAERAADAGWRPDDPGMYCSRCAHTVGPHEADGAGCSRCRGVKLPWARATRLGPYTGLLREAIHEVKFSAWRRLGTDLGTLLGRQLRPMLPCPPREVVVIPVPSTFRRRLIRGIDHTAAIAKAACRVIGGTYAPALRRRHRPPQVGLSNTDRRRNVAGTMALRGYPRFDGLTLLVIDDVRTTGATMGEACKALLRGLKRRGQTPAQVWACTLAVVEEGERAGERV